MLRVITSEWRKLRRPTLLWGTLGAVAAASILTNIIIFSVVDQLPANANRPGEELVSRAVLESARGVTIGFAGAAKLLGVIALAIFAAQTASEYTNGTLRNLLVREPRRLLLLVGKYVTMIFFALIIAVLAAVLSIVVSRFAAPFWDVSTSEWFTPIGWEGIRNTFVNVVVAMIGYGTLGMALGILLRSPISAISIGLAWLLPFEGILSAFLDDSSKWLPGALLDILAAGGILTVSYTRALTLSLIYVGLAAAIAALAFRRRDVVS